MIPQNLQLFLNAYELARQYAIKGNAQKCKEYLCVCLNALVPIYNNSSSIQEKAQCKALSDRIRRICIVLGSNGVDGEVCEFFKINRTTSSVVLRPVTPTPPPPSDPSSTHKPSPVSVSPADTGKEWSEVVYDKSIRGVVTIHVPDGSGTGFIISDKGFLLTNHHVVVKDKYHNTFHSDITMNFSDSRRLFGLEFIDADATYDIALCRFDPKGMPAFTALPRIPDYSTLKPGAAVVLIGNPVSQGIAPFTGTVSYTCSTSGDLVFSAPSNPGCSGGPVLDKNGFVVGVNKSLTVAVNGVKTQGFTNATPMNQVEKLLAKWKSKHGLSF